ncbi:MAG: hypothetical protein WA435_12130 [Gallionellaceae bacterium]
MNKLLTQMLLAFLCWFALTGQAIADTLSDTKHAQEIYFSSEIHPILFEVIENGVSTGQFVSVTIWASKLDETQRAECLITIFSKIANGKHIALSMFSASTDDATIRNLIISTNSISFDMTQFGKDRPLRFVAIREGKSSNIYQANAVGLWNGALDQAKLVKTEWRQVQSITLPSSTIDY